VAITVSDIQKTLDWYTQQFRCTIKYQDATWALVQFANISLAFVLAEQHPPHFAIVGDPAAYGQPKQHRDGTRSVYIKDPAGNNVEILALP
jgi:catechol 2,3-dioxygenase-like lactoylglutathione lyase family enzyme